MRRLCYSAPHQYFHSICERNGMGDFSKHSYFKAKEFRPGQLASAFRAVLAKFPESEPSISGKFDYGEGGTSRKDLTVADLEPICDLRSGHPSGVTLSLKNPGEMCLSHVVGLDCFDTCLAVYASSPDASNLTLFREVLQRELLLEEAVLTLRLDGMEDLRTRVAALENTLLKASPNLSCFLSYRFNPRSKSYVLELTRFLGLVGVNVVTGLGYEPRKISEKVIERLREGGHSFFIYLITREGESTWTRDELAVARGSDLPLVLLVEKGGEIGKGLLADWEYIEFEVDHIGDAFIPIMEAVSFIRRNQVERAMPIAVSSACGNGS